MLGQTDRACPDKLTQLQLLTGNCPVTGRYLEHWCSVICPHKAAIRELQPLAQ